MLLVLSLGIKQGPERTDKSKYVTDLEKRLAFANNVASKEARRQGRPYKSVYDLRVRESHCNLEIEC